MPDVIKPPPGEGGGEEDEQRQDDAVMDVMGTSGRDLPLQVLMLVLLLLGWIHANGLPVCRC